MPPHRETSKYKRASVQRVYFYEVWYARRDEACIIRPVREYQRDYFLLKLQQVLCRKGRADHRP